MSTKAQRLQRKIAAQHGEQFALERAVLNAARTLMGSSRKMGYGTFSTKAWDRFVKAETALHEYHAARNRRVRGRSHS